MRTFVHAWEYCDQQSGIGNKQKELDSLEDYSIERG